MLTVLLLNWRRHENMRRILDAFQKQSERPAIFLWDNCESGYLPQTTNNWSSGPDWVLDSSLNRVCMPRWFMGQFATTKYLLTCDDDLLPTDSHLCAQIEEEMEREADPFAIHGAFGKILVPGEKYEVCPVSERGLRCDIILGRMMCVRTEIVQSIALPYSNPLAETTDDIVLSGLLGGLTPRRHYCSEIFDDALQELSDEHALCHREGHFEIREQARRRWMLR